MKNEWRYEDVAAGVVENESADGTRDHRLNLKKRKKEKKISEELKI